MARSDRATIRVSGLPKSFLKARPDATGPTPREALRSLAKPFGLSSLAILHASRVALLEMESNAAADTMLAHHAATPLQISENIQLVLERTDQIIATKSALQMPDADVLSQCQRCVESLVAALERVEIAENAQKNRERHAAHIATIERFFAGHKFDRTSGRFCDLPPRLRTFHEVESYPADWRECSSEKATVNQRLIHHAIEHGCVGATSRCVVLDGPGGSTSRALLESSALGLDPSRIDCPNICTSSYEALRASGVCTPYLGSLRALLDSRSCPNHKNVDARYSLVYADYCCSLYANHREPELSPVHDLCTLFNRTANLLAEKAVLAVTLAKPDADKPRFPGEVKAAVDAAVGNEAVGGEDEDDASVLCSAVARLAEAAGYEAAICESFDLKGTFVRVWRIAAEVEGAHEV